MVNNNNNTALSNRKIKFLAQQIWNKFYFCFAFMLPSPVLWTLSSRLLFFTLFFFLRFYIPYWNYCSYLHFLIGAVFRLAAENTASNDHCTPIYSIFCTILGCLTKIYWDDFLSRLKLRMNVVGQIRVDFNTFMICATFYSKLNQTKPKFHIHFCVKRYKKVSHIILFLYLDSFGDF